MTIASQLEKQGRKKIQIKQRRIYKKIQLYHLKTMNNKLILCKCGRINSCIHDRKNWKMRV